jgi:hypothetical protein
MAFRAGNIQDAVARAQAARAALKEKANTTRFTAGSAQPGAGPNQGSTEFASAVGENPDYFSDFMNRLSMGPGGAPMA